MHVKHFNTLANRELLVFVAIVASAITLYVRQHVVDATAQALPQSTVQFGRMCEPSDSSSRDEKARVRPADCDMRTDGQLHRDVRPWV
jgi:hypothetical protein